MLATQVRTYTFYTGGVLDAPALERRGESRLVRPRPRAALDS
ncbi:MAG: hypothetical protein U0841_14450 [Chloroflexia bacterium]